MRTKKAAAAYALTRNVGDDLQSLALIAKMKRIDTIIDRDDLAGISESIGNTRGILNGWLSHTQTGSLNYNSLSQCFLPISFHIANGHHLSPDWIKYFSNFPDIFCRDIFTREQLKKRGVNAKFGGCLTLQLQNYFPAAGKKTIAICTEPRYIKNIKNTSIPLFLFEPNRVPLHIINSIPHRIAYCIWWLHLVSQSKAIVTDRLHTAIPACLYGAKTIFPRIEKENLPTGSAKRLSGLEALIQRPSGSPIAIRDIGKYDHDLLDAVNATNKIMSDWLGANYTDSELPSINKPWDIFHVIMGRVFPRIRIQSLEEIFDLSASSFLENLIPINSAALQLGVKVIDFQPSGKIGRYLNSSTDFSPSNHVARAFINRTGQTP